jgi:hypothetical protein
MHTEFGWGNVRERDHLEGPPFSLSLSLSLSLDGRIIINWIFNKLEGGHGLY